MRPSRFARGVSSASSGVAATAALLLLFATPAVARQIARVSVDSSGAEGNSWSGATSISADGHFVAFMSAASNLVAGDTNGYEDVFVHDRSTGITERVSLDSSGAQANNSNYDPSISADGQIVTFWSSASNLVSGDRNGGDDIFVRDRATGITERVSVSSSGKEGNWPSDRPSISADGQVVAFESGASTLVSGDTNGVIDIFVHDRATGITERVSLDSSGAQANNSSYDPSISADGQIVTFWGSASNLVAGDTNNADDVFVHDRATGITERVSVSSSGKQGNDFSYSPSISADGRLVAFHSWASNLVAGDTNGIYDVFVHDRVTGITERVSVDSSGAEGNSGSENSSISADGQVVVFDSYATNLVAGDNNGVHDVFRHDRATGITDRLSLDASGNEGNADSGGPKISADGQDVAFWSWATNLVAGDTNATYDIFESCLTNASWTNYGSGFPGTNGIPSLTSQQNPSFGATITLVLTNSYGAPTFGGRFIGYQRGNFNTKYGGQLLVMPIVIEPIIFGYGADYFTGTVPDDIRLCGMVFDLQGIEADPGAAYGVSFSPGLELVIGR